jgi:flagellar protein FlaG
LKVEDQEKLVSKIVPSTKLNIKGMEEQKKEARKKTNEKGTSEKLQTGKEELYKSVETANKMMTLSSYHLQFRVDKDSERIQVKLYDNETDEVIREIPSDQMLELSAKIKELIETFQKLVGVFVDEIA